METEYQVKIDNHVLPNGFNDCVGDCKKLSGEIPELQLHIDVCAKITSTARVSKIKEKVGKFISSQRRELGAQYKDFYSDEFLNEHIEKITVSDDFDGCVEDLEQCQLCFHVYQCHHDSAATEDLEGGQDDVSAATHWLLPAAEIEGLWENLIFDSEIKTNLLQYASTTILFSSANVDTNVISWNRVILLHGPPGTGKTSLCRALAQKLCIRMTERFRYGQLVEINSHGLFSKWFSESGKLVVKMFDKIQQLINDPEALVCILMDEVESLTAVRRASASEPSDAIRVVNALLTQLDQIKRFPNVLILTTSNVTGAIDLAFVDRADIKQYIGLPSPAAVYKIYTSCVIELQRTGIVSSVEQIYNWKTLDLVGDSQNAAVESSRKLRQISELSQGLSGRTIRKLPFLAHALFLNKPKSSLAEFLTALERAVRNQIKEREDLSHQNDAGIST